MSKELTKDEKIALVIEQGRVVGASVEVLGKLSNADLDAILAAELPKQEKVELTAEEEKELLKSLQEKYPEPKVDTPVVDNEWKSKYEAEVVKNRELKRQIIDKESVKKFAESIIKAVS